MQRFLRNSPFGAGGRPVRVFSQPITLEVQPRPDGVGHDWLPAENLELHDSWATEPPELRAGEPVTRTLSLRATGLSGTQIPALQLEQPPHTRVYPEPPINESRTDGDKVYAISTQTFTYIPGQAGELTIPAVEVPWWDTRGDERAAATLPEWVLKVEPGTAGTQPRPQESPSPARPASVPEARRTGIEPQAQGQGWLTQMKTFVWPWIVLVPLILLGAWLARKRFGDANSVAADNAPEVHQAPVIGPPAMETLVSQLQHACDANDAKQAAQALLELGHARWPDDPPRSLGQLATRLGSGREQVQMLDRALYAADASSWNGAKLWDSTKDAWKKKPVPKKPVDEVLEPLYPQRS